MGSKLALKGLGGENDLYYDGYVSTKGHGALKFYRKGERFGQLSIKAPWQGGHVGIIVKRKTGPLV